MSSFKKKHIYEIDQLIKQKIAEIKFCIRIKTIKNNNYDELIGNTYNLFYKQLVQFIMNKLDNLDMNLVNNRIDILLKTYLKNFI